MTLAGMRRYWPLLCLIPFLGWWTIGLTDLDEGFYGAVVADMIRRGDWITPSISGDPWFEKPILLYWLAIPSVQLFGDEVGPRLPSVAAALACCWICFRLAKDWISPEAGILSALAVSGSFLLAAVGRMMLTDALLAASFTGCMALFWASLHGRPQLRIGAAACLGLAVLAKGPVAGVFFILIAALAYWRLPSLRGGFKGAWLLAVPVGLAVIASWYLPAWLASGDLFVQKFLIEQNIGRFAGGDKAHGLPHWSLHVIFYPVVLAVGLLPWLPSAAKRGLFKPLASEEPHRDIRVFLWIWALTVLFFFSLSGSKLPHYIVPALPPLMILAVERILHGREEKVNSLMAWAGAWNLLVMVLAIGIFGAEYSRQKGPDLHVLARWLGSVQDEAVLFRFGRSSRDTDFGLEINETSRPSIYFYLKKPAIKTSEVAEVVDGRPRPLLLLAPKGRVTQEDRDEARNLGLLIPAVPTAQRGDFQIFRCIPREDR